MEAPFQAWVATDTAKVYADPAGDEVITHLLWGDGLELIGDEAENGRRRVRARGRKRIGWIPAADLEGGKPLLELYFIDVGQGDGVLVRTPDFRHILIDAGFPRAKQNTRKSAGDFIDWKFFEDYGHEQIELDVMIASHNDEDHYGGLSDLLDPDQYEDGAEFDASGITVENFYHAGLSWWRENGKRTLGPVGEDAEGRLCYTRLLTDRSSAEKGTEPGADPPLQGMWGSFIKRVVQARTSAGDPTPIQRLHPGLEYLPGFEAGNQSGVTIHVLGPIDFEVDGNPALPVLGEKPDKSTNGNSVLLRLDYGTSRILLTGDLNLAAHRVILDHYQGREDELSCDVAKACHHGSDDISFRFLEAMNAAATVISSGDGEGHDHPRPVIVAASGLAGHKEIRDERVITPLVYCTELARGVSLGKPLGLKVEHDDETLEIAGPQLDQAVITYSEQKPGDLRPRTRSRTLGGCSVVAGLIYGLVNVRSDGRKILAATMNEGNGSWSVKTFESRFP
jgi:beta-lactamase superfamily II metal-dependent hydrolase